MDDHISIDGNKFEGGGSILRVAVPLAIALGLEITVNNIRKKRRKPGLRMQHLIGLRLINEIVNGNLEGGEIGSRKITLTPGKYVKKKHSLQIPTAGSITLIMQIVQNYVVASGNEVNCSFQGGGTHTSFSPTWEEVQYVTAHHFKKFGIDFEMKRKRIGFYPKGGARGQFKISKSPTANPPQLEEKNTKEILRVYSIASNVLKKARVAERQVKGFQNMFPDQNIESSLEYVDGPPGTAIIAIYDGKYRKGYSQLGALGKPAEQVGSDLATIVKEDYQRNALDLYVSDQILVPLAFARSGTSIRIVNTSHVQANLHVIEQILPETLKTVNLSKHLLEVKKL